MFGDLALVEDDMPLGVDARGDERRGDLADAGGEPSRILRHGDSVQVHHAEHAVVRPLQVDELRDRAEVIAEMQVAGRLHAGEDAVRKRGHLRDRRLGRARRRRL